MIFLIRSEETSPRLQYVLDIVFGVHLGTEYQMIGVNEKLPADGILINYSRLAETSADINIYNAGLLFETGTEYGVPDVGNARGLPYLFRTPEAVQQPHTLPFDLFSMVFYCLSRYEEYDDYTPDVHGRFSSDQSLARLYGFLDLPLVDLWILELKKELETVTGTNIRWNRSFLNVPSIDIDIPYAFRGKGVLNLGGLLKDFFGLKLTRAGQRWQFLRGGPDPFDTYASMRRAFDDHGLASRYFALMRYQKPYDENHLTNDPGFHRLLIQLHKAGPVGIHPSVLSNQDEKLLEDERNRLEQITGTEVTSSRQHYLMVSLPGTYRTLISLGILEDSSMAYADRIGFRASTSIPFPWYDLEREEATSLMIFPPCIMDASMKWYMNMEVEDALAIVKSYAGVVKKVEGRYYWIWHNSSFSTGHGWKSWDRVFEALCAC